MDGWLVGLLGEWVGMGCVAASAWVGRAWGGGASVVVVVAEMVVVVAAAVVVLVVMAVWWWRWLW